MTAQLPTPPPLPGITWRPPQKDDAAPIALLQDACFETDGGYREVESEILTRWESDACNAETDVLIGVDSAGAVIASMWSIVPTVAETKWRAFNYDYVHPDYRTTETLEFVLAWWETRCRQRFGTRSDGLDQWLCRDAYDWQSDKIAFLEAHGYRPVRYFDELLRDLADSIDDHPLPGGLQVRTVESVAFDETRVVHNQAFSDHWGSQPYSERGWAVYDSEFVLKGASFVVYDDGVPVAYLLAAAFPHDFEDRGHSEAWIEGLGTVRSHRERGIASALVTMAMREFASSGMEYAILGVDSENPTGANGLYESLGFVHGRRSVSYNKQVRGTESGGQDG